MDETTKVLIATISGFLIAFLAEPVKTFFANNFKTQVMRKALYKEIYHNMIILKHHLTNETKAKDDFSQFSTYMFRFDAYKYAVSNEISTFFQLEEANDIRSLYLFLEYMIAANKLEDKIRWTNIIKETMIEAFKENIFNRRAFLDTNHINMTDVNEIIHEFEKNLGKT